MELNSFLAQVCRHVSVRRLDLMAGTQEGYSEYISLKRYSTCNHCPHTDSQKVINKRDV